MKKVVDWINSHKAITLCIVVALFIVQPLFVHWMFKTEAPSQFWESTWSAGDLLTYIAGFEAFVGTVLLSAVAVHQNEKANDFNNRLVDIEEKNSMIARSPNLEFEKQSTIMIEFWNVLDYRFMIFCSSETARKYRANKSTSKWYYLFSLRITNRSSSSIKIRLLELHLVSLWKEDPPQNYEIVPAEFPINSVDLPSEKEDYVGFLLDLCDNEDIKMYHGTMILSATNNALEEHRYTLEFFVTALSDLESCEIYMSEITHTRT